VGGKDGLFAGLHFPADDVTVFGAGEEPAAFGIEEARDERGIVREVFGDLGLFRVRHGEGT
jgi:hypothetical protein